MFQSECSIYKKFFVISLIFFIIFGTQAKENKVQNIKQEISKHTESFQCKGSSPFFNIKYGQQNPKQLKNQIFCNEVSQRTCCNNQNFEALKQAWYMFNYNLNEVSSQCQIQFNEIICSECDADIGTQLRKGICQNICDNFYNNCVNDLFKMEENRVKYCNQNDMICSPLKSIFTDSTSFCDNIGFKVNQNSDYQVWMEDLKEKQSQESIQPVCWDGKPSQKYFYPATEIQEKQSSSWGGSEQGQQGQQSKKIFQGLNNERLMLYGSFIFIILSILVGFCLYCRFLRESSLKKEQEVQKLLNKNKVSSNNNKNTQAFKGRSVKLE
ncbi:hypothetical protein PPERSA_07016 [Pseudocohnilembus persalinus]|uniref:Uncharacterized protein n=1 Tax=Pseudocohnilembus persalinus TaxID=266149 RepID=A0A0V0QLV3_PSEPJ|nr:hypothetical protein PPERSA_07016 [Pseudocohnilembus persalinus]|eukprot:KRX03188.1 hypothetical protein PPERSA_07016 [Pseudocohnilembus persalinus]